MLPLRDYSYFVRAMQARDLIHTERGRIAVGWLIVEDLAMVIALVLLPPLAQFLGGGATGGGCSGAAAAADGPRRTMASRLPMPNRPRLPSSITITVT